MQFFDHLLIGNRLTTTEALIETIIMNITDAIV